MAVITIREALKQALREEIDRFCWFPNYMPLEAHPSGKAGKPGAAPPSE